jgi:hypothetical protein
LTEHSPQDIKASDASDLDQRLGLYRVFLKLYEHHRGLLDEILDLENTDNKWRTRVAMRYVQGVVQGHQVQLVTNLLKGETQALQQPEGVWIIGRDRKAAFSLQDKRLSRRHAAIQYIQNQGFYLIDLDSTNGSFVNGEPVRHCTLLKDGDQVRLSSLSFTFFACSDFRVAKQLPPEVLEQVNTIRNAIAFPDNEQITQDSNHLPIKVDWDTSLPAGSEETSMFLIPPLPEDELLPKSAIHQLSTSQQADILDRFLKR